MKDHVSVANQNTACNLHSTDTADSEGTDDDNMTSEPLMQELSEGTSTCPDVNTSTLRSTFAVCSGKKCKHETVLYVKMTTLVQLLSGRK